MNGQDWVLIDTETNGLTQPIVPVEIAAQRMVGWKRSGPPFRCLLNQNAELSPEVSRVHGYTREILERDGQEPLRAYGAFGTYVGDRPICSFNLVFDLDRVLTPEYVRLGIAPIGLNGICMLRLAQRLLDPVPAGNCKLQTLRQYYRLPDRAAHTALGDVDTVVDLLQEILRPIALSKGLLTWTKIKQFTEEEWFQTRVPFGKYKGRMYQEAKQDKDFLGWLEWLASSSSQRSRQMGRWYLDQLNDLESVAPEARDSSPFPQAVDLGASDKAANPTIGDVVSFVDREAERFRSLIGFSRARLAEIQAEYMAEKSAVDTINAALFRLVCDSYQRRDRLRLTVSYRRRFLEVLLARGEEDAEEVANEYEEAQKQSDGDYKDASKAAADKADLTAGDQAELKAIWNKLVRLYHPDRFAGDGARQAIYEQLTAAINQARDTANLPLLREIANDPDGFITRQGWANISINLTAQAEDLRKLHEAIEIQIVQRIDALLRLRESPEYELSRICRASPEALSRVANEQIRQLEAEIAELSEAASQLALEIRDLTGQQSRVMPKQ
jgi:DNA polymerase III epsilon subunit-like protein